MIRMVSMPGTPWKASLEANSSRTGKEIYGTDGPLGYSVDSALAEVFCAKIILCWRTGTASAVQTALPMARRVWMTGDQDI